MDEKEKENQKRESEMINLRSWEHPKSGEVRVYLNGDFSKYTDSKVWIVKNVDKVFVDHPEFSGNFEIHSRGVLDGMTIQGGRMTPDSIVEQALADNGLNINDCRWGDILEKAN